LCFFDDDDIIYLDLQRKQFIPFDIGYTSTAISVQVNPQLCAGVCLCVSHKNLFFSSLFKAPGIDAFVIEKDIF
jgi:hypothetical protein